MKLKLFLVNSTYKLLLFYSKSRNPHSIFKILPFPISRPPSRILNSSLTFISIKLAGLILTMEDDDLLIFSINVNFSFKIISRFSPDSILHIYQNILILALESIFKVIPKITNIKASITNKTINSFILFLEVLYIPNSFKSVPQFLQKRVLSSIFLPQFGHTITSLQNYYIFILTYFFNFIKKC